uniref:Uncharacterized protein n=1 Tax=Haemonchus contortus TaxID=6289 RepID=A0A7I4YLN6_HAECO
MLSHFNVTLSYIKVVCTTATGETATGFFTLKKINSAIARLHNITLESSLPAESIDLSDIPTIEEMHAATGGPVTVSPTPLESPETSTAQAVRRTTQKSTSDLHIRSSTFVTTTRRANAPPHHKKITVSLTPRTSPTPSSSSRNRGTRTVCAVRTVSSSRSPGRHRRRECLLPVSEDLHRRESRSHPTSSITSVRETTTAQDALKSKVSRIAP